MLCGNARPAAAQSLTAGLSALLMNESAGTGDFVRDVQAAAITRDTVASWFLTELSTLPINSSSAAFIYRLNPDIGTVERASRNFGPFFVERAMRPGAQQLSLGMAFRDMSFTHFDGASLTDGTFLTTASRFTNQTTPFYVETVALRLKARTVTMFGSYGITDRLEISAAVPIVDLSVRGQRFSTLERGPSALQFEIAGGASGLADIALRARYQVFDYRNLTVAGATDVRLPTGSKNDLLGAGRTAVKHLALVSLEGATVAAHVNAGATWGGVSDQINYGGAITFAAGRHVTLAAEVQGRRLRNLKRVTLVAAPHPTLPEIETLRWLPEGKRADSAFAVTGLKWNLYSDWLLSASMAVRLTEVGLTGRVTPMLTLDRTFIR